MIILKYMRVIIKGSSYIWREINGTGTLFKGIERGQATFSCLLTFENNT